jgi:hypothetical protein
MMLGEHALNSAVIDGIVVAVPHNPRQLASGNEMGHAQPHDMLLEVPRQKYCCSRLPPCMRQGTLIDQA